MDQEKKVLSCVDCYTQNCYRRQSDSFPQFCPTTGNDEELCSTIVDKMKKSHEIKEIFHTAAEVEGQFYGKLTRVEETIEFLQHIGAKKVGIATCVGLIKETRMLSKIFDKKGIKHIAVCCKVGSADKSEAGIPDENKLNRGCGFEAMCNPIMQAEIFNREETDFNIIMGLCVGHDMLFSMNSKAPVTTLVVKDRVLGHNPVVALYTSETMYSRFK